GAKTQADVWTAFSMKSLLGGALLGQKKYADAEPLLRAGYQGMKQREKTIPPQDATRLCEALDRLIELSTATSRPNEATKWRAERAKYSDLLAAAFVLSIGGVVQVGGEARDVKAAAELPRGTFRLTHVNLNRNK